MCHSFCRCLFRSEYLITGETLETPKNASHVDSFPQYDYVSSNSGLRFASDKHSTPVNFTYFTFRLPLSCMLAYLCINHRRPNTTLQEGVTFSRSQIRCYVTIYAICCETTTNKTRVSPKHKARVNANMGLVLKFVNTSSCFDWLVITMLRWRRVQKSPHKTMEQRTWPVLNCALPSPGQGQFVSPAIRSGFECVHCWPQQHDLSARMASFLRFTAL